MILLNFMEFEVPDAFSNSKFVLVSVVCGRIKNIVSAIIIAAKC